MENYRAIKGITGQDFNQWITRGQNKNNNDIPEGQITLISQ